MVEARSIKIRSSLRVGSKQATELHEHDRCKILVDYDRRLVELVPLKGPPLEVPFENCAGWVLAEPADMAHTVTHEGSGGGTPDGGGVQFDSIPVRKAGSGRGRGRKRGE